MVKLKTPTQARQGERGKPMLWVLAISTAAAVIIAVLGYMYILSQPDQELADPVPQVEETQ